MLRNDFESDVCMVFPLVCVYVCGISALITPLSPFPMLVSPNPSKLAMLCLSVCLSAAGIAPSSPWRLYSCRCVLQLCRRRLHTALYFHIIVLFVILKVLIFLFKPSVYLQPF